MLRKTILLFVLIVSGAGAAEPEAKLETKLDYSVDLPFLEKGNFQYFYGLLKQDEKKEFENLYSDQSETKVEEILNVFLPLDIKNKWDPKDDHFLAVAKISYLLPISLNEIKEERFTAKDYLQKTLPRYEVTQRGENFHVGGSLITPDFDLEVSFLGPDHPYVDLIPLIDKEKLKSGKIKVSFMYQDNFGKVFFFKTAKASNALIIYEAEGDNRTLVTQYISSNVINVPTKDLIRKGMIENISDVVKGSRSEATNSPPPSSH